MFKTKIHKKPKIAIYSGEIPSTTFIERLIEGITEKGFEVYLFGVIYSRKSYPKHIKNKGYKANKLNKGLFFIKYALLLWIFRFRDKRRLDLYISKHHRNTRNSQLRFYPILWHQPDIFHLQWAKGIADWMWVQDFGIGLVLSLRGAHINYSPIVNPKLADIYKRCFPKVDYFHSVSNAIREEGMSYGAQLIRAEVVYSGLDLSKLSMRSFSLPAIKLRLISVGRSHWIKGYPIAVSAISLLIESGWTLDYKIVGGGHSEELRYQVHEKNLQNEVCLLPKLDFNTVKFLIQEADLMILSSLKEGLPNVVLEAMALGTIVIASKCGGIEEVIEDNFNGFLVPVRDPKALAEKIQYVASLPEARLEAVRLEARKTIERNHSMEMMVEGMSALYEQLKINN